MASPSAARALASESQLNFMRAAVSRRCWQDSSPGQSLNFLICPMGIEQLPLRVIEDEMIQFMGSGWRSAWLTISS